MKVDGNIIKVGSPLLYAAIHQEGGKIVARRSYLNFKVGNRFIKKKSVFYTSTQILGVQDDFCRATF
jgi:phage gpG-like protein